MLNLIINSEWELRDRIAELVGGWADEPERGHAIIDALTNIHVARMRERGLQWGRFTLGQVAMGDDEFQEACSRASYEFDKR